MGFFVRKSTANSGLTVFMVKFHVGKPCQAIKVLATLAIGVYSSVGRQRGPIESSKGWFKQGLFICHPSSFKTEYNKLHNKQKGLCGLDLPVGVQMAGKASLCSEGSVAVRARDDRDVW